MPEIDDVFRDDQQGRWFSDFVKLPASGKNPRLQDRVIERARLLDLYFRIRYPALAATFGLPEPANDN